VGAGFGILLQFSTKAEIICFFFICTVMTSHPEVRLTHNFRLSGRHHGFLFTVMSGRLLGNSVKFAIPDNTIKGFGTEFLSGLEAESQRTFSLAAAI